MGRREPEQGVGPAPWQAEIDLPLPRVEALVATAFPDLAGAPVAVLGEGFDNLAVRVAGRVLRFPRRAAAARLFERECAWLAANGERLPVPVPRPDRLSGPILGHPFAFGGYPELRGTTGCRACLSEAGRAALAEPLGRFLGVLHGLSVPVEHWGDPDRRSDVPRRGRRALERAQDLGLPPAFARVVEAGMAAPAWEGRPTWVHGDLYGRHVLVEDGVLVGVIDWGDVHVGDPAVDLSIAWSFLPPAAHGPFLAAYARPVDDLARTRARAIALTYGPILVHYGRSVGDAAAEALGHLAIDNGLHGPP